MLTEIQIFVLRIAGSLKTVVHDQRGATATEYGILLSFLALAIVLGVAAFGNALNTHYLDMTTTLKTALGIP